MRTSDSASPLTERALRAHLKTRLIGKQLFCFERVNSTNDVAWQKALEGAPEGTVVFAEEQTHGRGRFGRSWFAPKGMGLLMSVLLRPEIPVEKASMVTALAALAVAQAMEDVGAHEVEIRFPNDVLIRGKKAAGVLVESRLISGRANEFVVGIGVNVNIPHQAFPKELEAAATSLMLEVGKEIDRASVAARVLEALEQFYLMLREGREDLLAQKWRTRSNMLKRRVAILERGKIFVGVVEDIDPLEGIVLRTEHGTLQHFRGGTLEQVRLME